MDAVLLNRTNALGVGLPSGSAIAAPLVDQDLRAVGAVTLLCEDGGRAWTSDEAKLLGWCAQLLAMHAQIVDYMKRSYEIFKLDNPLLVRLTSLAQSTAYAVVWLCGCPRTISKHRGSPDGCTLCLRI